MSASVPLRAFVRPSRLALAVLLGVSAAAGAAPLYHLTVLGIPDASSVSVKDINNAGQMVGTYSGQDFSRHAVLWDATGWHDLALPDGTEGIAFAINNAGRIVGTADDFVQPTRGLLWDASAPAGYVVLNSDPAVAVSPEDISDAGVVVGGLGLPNHAFVWSQDGGLVDYGVQDPTMDGQQARWAAVNSAGKLVGRWSLHFATVHATVGQVGTPAVQAMGSMAQEFASNATAINEAGVAVGLGLAVDAPQLVPVVFADDGSFTEIPGATLDQGDGAAAAINNHGVIVGTAGIGTANGPVPGMKAWVHRDGATYDLFDVVDDHGGFASFSSAVAVNDAGAIVGVGRLADDSLGSFLLTPIAGDAIFADGFDTAAR